MDTIYKAIESFHVSGNSAMRDAVRYFPIRKYFKSVEHPIRTNGQATCRLSKESD